MHELERTLAGNGVTAPPANILEDVNDALAHRKLPGAPHSIYEELWHLAFWQQLTALWIKGTEAPYPEHASLGFPSAADKQKENWHDLRQRFLQRLQELAALTHSPTDLNRAILCPSRGGSPSRTMSVRDQLESLAAHNAYHLGRIVLLRQLSDAWPPPSGGDTW